MENSGNYNFNWDSFYSVSNDQKFEIIRKVRNLDGTEDDSVIDDFKEEWNSLSTEGEDPTLNERFEKEIAKFNEKKERVGTSIEGKRALIEKVEALKDSDDFYNVAEKFKEFQAEWRKLGFSGKKLNDTLWEEFSAINDYFFNRRNEFYEQQNQEREEAKNVKEALIEEAEAIQDSTDWYKTSRKQRELMDAWREAGFASREVEQELWERFNAARQVFYKSQEEFFKGVREAEAKAKEIKEALIEETHALKNSLDFETIRTRFDEMMEAWKDAGHSGRKHEEDLWARFREGRDYFYARMSELSEQTREERREAAFDSLDDLNHRIESLEEMKVAIEAKIVQLENRPEDEETLAELEETKGYLEENQNNLNELYEELKRVNLEIDRI